MEANQALDEPLDRATLEVRCRLAPLRRSFYENVGVGVGVGVGEGGIGSPAKASSWRQGSQ